MQFKNVRLILASSLVALAAAVPQAQAADNAATVNGKAIPASRVDVVVRQVSKQGQSDSPQLRAAIKEDLISKELFAQEVERRGLSKSDEYQLELQAAKDRINVLALVQDMEKKSPTKDEEIKAEYEKMKVVFGNKEYHVRQILVDSEELAKSLIEQLKKGAKFEELAKQSKDASLASNGGDIGWVVPAKISIKELGESVVKLEKGKFTEIPVKTPFGFHLVKLEDTRPLKFPSLDEAKPQLLQGLQLKRLKQLQIELRGKAKLQ